MDGANDNNNNNLNKQNIKYYCDNVPNQSEMECSDDDDRDSDGRGASLKASLSRAASLGSWERPVKSGRFSVSPVEVVPNCSTTDIQINVDMVTEGDSPEGGASGQSNLESMDTRSYSSDEDNSDMSQNETDQLTELPTKFDIQNMSRLLPPQRSFRRMSSPAISVNAKPKPKPAMQLKLSGNLESLDLKSSLPLSPTFFAKFGNEHPYKSIILFYYFLK